MDLAERMPSQQTTGSSSGMSLEGHPALCLMQPNSPQHGSREHPAAAAGQEFSDRRSLDAAVQKVLEKAKVTSEKNRKVANTLLAFLQPQQRNCARQYHQCGCHACAMFVQAQKRYRDRQRVSLSRALSTANLLMHRACTSCSHLYVIDEQEPVRITADNLSCCTAHLVAEVFIFCWWRHAALCCRGSSVRLVGRCLILFLGCCTWSRSLPGAPESCGA